MGQTLTKVHPYLMYILASLGLQVERTPVARERISTAAEGSGSVSEGIANHYRVVTRMASFLFTQTLNWKPDKKGIIYEG